MKIEKFEDIIGWQKAKALSIGVYTSFRLLKDYGFKDQIQRASVSVMNNIAEGYERRGDKEFKKFLFITKGSVGEVRSMLDLAFELKYISKNNFEPLYKESVEILRILSGLIKSLE